jgi:hypothetical protein
MALLMSSARSTVPLFFEKIKLSFAVSVLGLFGDRINQAAGKINASGLFKHVFITEKFVDDFFVSSGKGTQLV